MPRKQRSSAPKWAVILALALLLATTALAAAQSPDLHLPFITGEGETTQAVPEVPLDSDSSAPVGDSRDTNSGDHEAVQPAEVASVAAFNATQWTVQNRLGLGTTAPSADIDISRNANTYSRIWMRNPNAGSNAQTQLYLNTATDNGVVLQQFGAGYTGTWGPIPLKNMTRLRTTPNVKAMILTTGGAAPLLLGTADAERMRITPDGKVGIGVTAPGARLGVAGGAGWTYSNWGAEIELENGGAIGWQPNAGGYSWGMGQSTGGFYLFHTRSRPATKSDYADPDLFIDYNGRVGIGVTDPDYNLEVDGSVNVRNGNLSVNHGGFFINGNIFVQGQQMNVPDYVFEPEYPLMSLDELRAYIAAEKHLPNVPSEKEIRAGNLDLTDFQMKLLEKTEELTLYTLDQDEQLQAQKQQIEGLQQEKQSMQQQVENLQQTNQSQGDQLEALQQVIGDLEARLAALEEQK